MTTSFLEQRFPLIQTTLSRWAEVKLDDRREEQFSNDLDIPEEIMAKAEKILGDGAARVSAGVDMARKEFGNGFGVHVSVSLNCNQDDNSIELAAEMVKDLAHGFAEEHYQEAAELYEHIDGQVGSPSGR
jgi:hypothetical protein